MKTSFRILAVLLAVCAVPAATHAKDVRMIAPNIPPHFDTDGRGRIGDAVRAVLERCGHTVRFSMVPFGRHWKDYADNDSFDGLATAEADQTFPGFTTKPFMHLQDGATVVAGRGLDKIESASQLAGKQVVAFPNADKILGIEKEAQSFKGFSMRAERFD